MPDRRLPSRRGQSALARPCICQPLQETLVLSQNTTPQKTHCVARTEQCTLSKNLGLNTSVPPGKARISSRTGGSMGSRRPETPRAFFHSTRLCPSDRGSASANILNTAQSPPCEENGKLVVLVPLRPTA